MKKEAGDLAKNDEDVLAVALFPQVAPKFLENKYNKKFIINTHIDENLIAGVKVVIGDLVIDGSVSNKLERLKSSIKKANKKERSFSLPSKTGYPFLFINLTEHLLLFSFS